MYAVVSRLAHFKYNEYSLGKLANATEAFHISFLLKEELVIWSLNLCSENCFLSYSMGSWAEAGSNNMLKIIFSQNFDQSTNVLASGSSLFSLEKWCWKNQREQSLLAGQNSSMNKLHHKATSNIMFPKTISWCCCKKSDSLNSALDGNSCHNNITRNYYCL